MLVCTTNAKAAPQIISSNKTVTASMKLYILTISKLLGPIFVVICISVFCLFVFLLGRLFLLTRVAYI